MILNLACVLKGVQKRKGGAMLSSSYYYYRVQKALVGRKIGRKEIPWEKASIHTTRNA